MLPKVTQEAGMAQADPGAAQTWRGDCWQVPEPAPSGLWKQVNKGNISTKSQWLAETDRGHGPGPRHMRGNPWGLLGGGEGPGARLGLSPSALRPLP